MSANRRHGMLLDDSEEYEGHLLHQAAIFDNVSLLKSLLEGDAAHHINACDPLNRSVLYTCVAHNSLKCAKLLLEYGADCNTKTGEQCDCTTALHIAVTDEKPSFVSLLLRYGADMEALNSSGQTPYSIAITQRNTQLLDMMKEELSRRTQHKDDYKQKFYEACLHGRVGEAEKLAMHLSSEDITKVINCSTEQRPVSLLYRCAELGYADVVRFLMQNKAEAKVHETTGYSALHIACLNGHILTAKYIIKYCPDLLLIPTIEATLPLHIIAAEGYYDLLKMLLTYSYPDKYLHTYQESGKDRLYKLSFPINARNSIGQSALHIACECCQKDIVRLLLGFKVKLLRRTSMIQAGEQAGERRKSDACTTQPEGEGNGDGTPHGGTEMFCPVNLDDLDLDGNTPLHLAIKAKHSGNDHLEIARMLLSAGADVNKPLISPSGNSTALIEAAQLADTAMVNLLLQHKAVDHNNKVLATALLSHDYHIVAALLNYHSYVDSDHKINRLALYQSMYECGVLQMCESTASMSTLTSGAVTTAVVINWYQLNLTTIKMDWLQSCSQHHNPGLMNPTQQALSLYAITRIDVSHNHLVSLPAQLFTLKSLRLLNASHNKITELSVSDCSVDSLQSSTSSNQGSDVFTEQYDCPVLDIQLDYNKLKTLPSWLFHFPSLQKLSVTHNRIQTLPITVWCSQSLTDLNLSHNLLSSLPTYSNTSNSMTQSHSTAALAVTDGTSMHSNDGSSGSSGGGTDVPQHQPHGVPAVSSGSIAAGNIIDATTTVPVPNTTATVHHQMFTVQGVHHHNHWIERLQVIEADGNPEDSDQSKQQCQLKDLNLSHNQFTSVPPMLACICVSLQKLNLSYNSIHYAAAPSFYPNSITVLDLSHNQIDSQNLYDIKDSDDGALISEKCLDYQCYSASLLQQPTPSTSGGSKASVSSTAKSSSTSSHPSTDATQSPQVLPSPNPLTTRRASSSGVGVVVAGGGGGGSSHPASLTTTHSSTSTASSSTDTQSHSCHSCTHKAHRQLTQLRHLDLSGNRLTYLSLMATSTSIATATTAGDIDATANNSMSSPNPTSPRIQPSATTVSASYLLYPCLHYLDVSSNHLTSLPSECSQLGQIAELKIGNNKINELPPDLGDLSKLWNLDMTGCPVAKNLQSILGPKAHKTSAILGYLKSIKEEATLYNRMKLMFVGVQGIGKTSLLNELRKFGKTSTHQKNWAQRMGHGSMKDRDLKGDTLSTVGVDIGDLVFQRAGKEVIFRTWDFGGQKEYYATHQYFISKRALYLVVWKVTDGEAAVNAIHQWLVNIQARAPNSPVIIVGTHLDKLTKPGLSTELSYLRNLIRSRYMMHREPEKCGLPRVLDHIEVSCKPQTWSTKNKHVNELVRLIIERAFSEVLPGSRDIRLLEQKVPASYVKLQDVVHSIAIDRRKHNLDPVLNTSQYRLMVLEEMERVHQSSFKDIAMLNQATQFLHENGMLLHYDDVSLQDLYFIDPQWLCDILANIITIREINSLAKSGIMKTDDLKILFKNFSLHTEDVQSYIINLLSKFEVALLWDSQHLLIPSLLPTEAMINAASPHNTFVQIPVLDPREPSVSLVANISADICLAPMVSTRPHHEGKSTFYLQSHLTDSSREKDGNRRATRPTSEPSLVKSSVLASHRPLSQPAALVRAPTNANNRAAIRATSINATVTKQRSVDTESGSSSTDDTEQCTVHDVCPRHITIREENNPSVAIVRLYMMAYFPSGFWPRFITRLLADSTLYDLIQNVYPFPIDLSDCPVFQSLPGCEPQWLCWQSGIELKYHGITLCRIKECLDHASDAFVDYRKCNLVMRMEDDLQWKSLDMTSTSILEIWIPNQTIVVNRCDECISHDSGIAMSASTSTSTSSTPAGGGESNDIQGIYRTGSNMPPCSRHSPLLKKRVVINEDHSAAGDTGSAACSSDVRTSGGAVYRQSNGYPLVNSDSKANDLQIQDMHASSEGGVCGSAVVNPITTSSTASTAEADGSTSSGSATVGSSKLTSCLSSRLAQDDRERRAEQERRNKQDEPVRIIPNSQATVTLLAKVVDHIDTLLEDWYPDIGIRFVQNSIGMYLITRVVPCVRCLVQQQQIQYKQKYQQQQHRFCTGTGNADESWDVLEQSDIQAYSKPIHIHHPNSTDASHLGGAAVAEGGGGGAAHSFGDLLDDRSPTPVVGSAPVGKLTQAMGALTCVDIFPDGDPTSPMNAPQPAAPHNSSTTAHGSSAIDNGAAAAAADDDDDDKVVITDCSPVYCYIIEQCQQAAQQNRVIFCKEHGNMGPWFIASDAGYILSGHMAPDTVFQDIGDEYLVNPDHLERGPFLGKGAFGAVFSGTIVHQKSGDEVNVAIKMLQPVHPGPKASSSLLMHYQLDKQRWDKDPMKSACEAYLSARKELSILLSLQHHHIVPLIGLTFHPLSLILSLAPLGALNTRLKEYNRVGARLTMLSIRAIILQVASALHYLHSKQIIYRDLKSENVLVWSFPLPGQPPGVDTGSHKTTGTGADTNKHHTLCTLQRTSNATSNVSNTTSRSTISTSSAAIGGSGGTTSSQQGFHQCHGVHIKLADYGVSRTVLPSGAKGLAGTPPFIAPEIIQHSGEEAYTEKVDCFSFGMFIYELVALRMPFEDEENGGAEVINLRGHVLAGGRPSITSKDLIYSSLLFDLMTQLWSADPTQRPSTAQILDITRTQHFTHCCDVVSIDDVITVIDAKVVMMTQYEVMDSFPEENEQEELIELWMIVKSHLCTQLRVYKYKSLYCTHTHVLPLDQSYVCMCVVNATVWLAAADNTIHVYSAQSYEKRHQFDLGAMLTNAQATPLSLQLTDASIIHMLYSCTQHMEDVVYVTMSTGNIIVCDAIYYTRPTLHNNTATCTAIKQCAHTNITASVLCVTVVRVLGREELWCGHDSDLVSIWRCSDMNSKSHHSAKLSHHINYGVTHKTPVSVTAIHTSPSVERKIWTLVTPGSSIYQWDIAVRSITSKLDIRTLPKRTFTTAAASSLVHLEVCSLCVQDTTLYIGTNTGHLLVCDAASMTSTCVLCVHPNNPVTTLLTLTVADSYNLSSTSTDKQGLITLGRGYYDAMGDVIGLEGLHNRQAQNYAVTWCAQNWSDTVPEPEDTGHSSAH